MNRRSFFTWVAVLLGIPSFAATEKVRRAAYIKELGAAFEHTREIIIRDTLNNGFTHKQYAGLAKWSDLVEHE